MNGFLDHLLLGGVIFAIVTILVILLTRSDTPEEKGKPIFGKNRLVGILIVLTGAIGIAVIKWCLPSQTWVAELYTTLTTGFTSAVSAVYINKGYSVERPVATGVGSALLNTATLPPNTNELSDQQPTSIQVSVEISMRTNQ